MMKRELVRKTLVGMAVAAALTAGIGTAQAGHPRSAASTVTRTGPAGNTGTRHSSVATNGQGGYTAGSTITGPNGNSAARQQSGSYNAATQTYSRSGTTTGPNGNSSNFQTSVTATGNGLQRSATRTGPNGNSASESRSVTVTPAAQPTGN